MEKGITNASEVTMEFDSYVREVFEVHEMDVQEYSPLTLAYIGDCVFDMIIKTIVVGEGNKQVQKLHQQTSSFVQASAQSQMMRKIQEVLTEEELKVYRRGRNTKTVSPAKNQSLTDYRRATGFESLLGYLYLQKQYKRMVDLVKIGMDSMEGKIDESGK